MSDQELRTSRSIQEFWIDLLLEEEFCSDPNFAKAFIDACEVDVCKPTVTKVTYSLNDEYGEADLVVEFSFETDGGDFRAALLIENKITAEFQPHQAARYAARRDSGLSSARWSLARTVLVAPKAYIRPGHGFECSISLEQLSDWICVSDPQRAGFKRQRIQAAIEKKNSSGVQIVDPVMTEFRRWYTASMMQREAEQPLGFVPPAPRPAYWDDNWIEWTSTKLPAACKFRHMTRTGVIDVRFDKVPVRAVDWLSPLLPPKMSIVALGRRKQHAAIQQAVDPIVDYSDFSSTGRTAEQALSAAQEMQTLLLAHLEQLNSSLSSREPLSESCRRPLNL